MVARNRPLEQSIDFKTFKMTYLCSLILSNANISKVHDSLSERRSLRPASWDEVAAIEPLEVEVERMAGKADRLAVSFLAEAEAIRWLPLATLMEAERAPETLATLFSSFELRLWCKASRVEFWKKVDFLAFCKIVNSIFTFIGKMISSKWLFV